MKVKIITAEHWYKKGEEYEVENHPVDNRFYKLKDYPEKHKIPIIRKENCVVVKE